ncbi:GTP pyrophosphokinase [Vibrio gigantis]|uniref:RelA/SpoT domain-containing protein n=1 Tax=Vibrio gigantis TaxID=296199 RepID=A0A5M9N5M7_9VIBR|nr:hypothetical protein [Vibrio gigantis]KAA8663133.1 hypothetical protein F4W18_25690 [Vibrio gigantis]
MKDSDEIIKEYSKDKAVYDSLEKVTNGLISTLLSNDSIDVHSITSRCKTVSSLRGKVNRPDKSYSSLKDITDIVGLRVTTYFSDHVDIISQIIENEFVVDRENSIDKRKAIEPDRFGYMSLHLVAEHADTRTNLPEYKKFKGIKFEIQIRTILQHAWAEIEHDIGYKSSSQVPVSLRRRFSRLSGLLELADEEFFGIRNEISAYKNELVDSIKSNPLSVNLDLDSIESFVSNNELVNELENEFSKVFNCPLTDSSRNMLSRFLNHMNSLDINTIHDLSDAYLQSQQYLVPFLEIWLMDPDGSKAKFPSVERGISLLYVCYITLALRDDEKYFQKFIENSKFGANIESKIKSTFSRLSVE